MDARGIERISIANVSATFFGDNARNYIPKDICNIIAVFIANNPAPIAQYEKIAPMAVNCPGIYHAFNQVFSQALCQYVVYGDQAKAEEIITAHPDLLLCSGRVNDYSKRNINGTPLGIALGAEDVKYHDDEVCMVEMIHKYLKQLPSGETIIAEQTAKQFPEGWEDVEAARVRRDAESLRKVFAAIAESNDGDNCDGAIQAFRAYLDQENKGKGVIKTGKHFNHQLLVEALELYNQHYDRFGGLDSPKNNIFWRKVIGTIERYVPAATAQALCTGVGTIVDEKAKLKRKLTLHNYHTNRSISYFPLDADSGSLLGRDFAVYSYYGSRASDIECSGTVAGPFAKLMVNKKHQTCSAYAAPTAPAKSLGQVCNLLK